MLPVGENLMNKANIIEAIKQEKIIAILRGLNEEELINTVAAMEKGGVYFAEVTFNSKGEPDDETTAGYIRTLAKRFAGKVHVGAGTVLTERQAILAAKAGAEFIISPDANPKVIRKTVKLGMVSIPGALTPSEAMTAYGAGADFVKLFPIAELGIPYLKAITAPLSQIPFLAVGGVDENNIADFIRAGACGAGIGNGIVNKQLIKAGDFEGITRLAEKYASALQTLK